MRYTVLATDAAGAHVDARCSHASATVFPIGLTTVSCTATDARGNTAQPSVFTVRVKGASLQLADALAEVRSWHMRSPVLANRLQQVGRALAAKPQRACLLIGTLRHDLRGPFGKTVPAAHRAQLSSLLARIARVSTC